MFDCTTEKYELLYRRWLGNPGKLLDVGGFKPGMTVLDLCGGTGVVASEALRRGASYVLLYDLAPRGPHEMDQLAGDAERLWSTLLAVDQSPSRFDLIVCRQAIAYLNVENVAVNVTLCLRPGGKFVFNTFIEPRWSAKRYQLDHRRYVELAGHVGRRCWHVQAAWPGGIDVTTFQFTPIDEMIDVLTKHFTVRVETSDRSAYFICSRRS